MRRSGFTLIELLVVIAIIAILAAILFPVFERAKNKAQQAACINNLKQMATAVLMYAHDWDTMLPQWSYATYATAPGSIPVPPTAAYHGAWGGQSGWMWPYVQSEGVYVCPSVVGMRNMGYVGTHVPAACSYEVYYSYESNSWWDGTQAKDWTGTFTYAGKQLDYFNYPAHFIIFLDGATDYMSFPEQRGSIWVLVTEGGFKPLYGTGPALYPNSNDPNANPGIWSEWSGSNTTILSGAMGRHTATVNCAFLDGHVKDLTPAMLWDAVNKRALDYYFDASVTGGQSQP